VCEVKFEKLVPSIHLVTDRDAFFYGREISDWVWNLLRSTTECADFGWPVFRGVSSDRIITILNSGVDVVPTDAPIWANDLEKALEYGGGEKVVLILNSYYMSRTYKLVPDDFPPTELAAVQSVFGKKGIIEPDGKTTWYSKMAELPESEAGIILSVMGEAQILTALHVAEVIQIKLNLVRGLRKRVEEKQLENAIRDYIADHPWLVDSRYEFYKKETSLANILADVATAIRLDEQPDFAKRVDLLLSSGDHLVLMEFMRPGITIDRDHLDRFAQYVDEIRARIEANTGGPFRRVTGTIVADKLEKSKPGNQQAIKRLAGNDMYALDWSTLLANSERQYKEYSAIMVQHSPDDPRVRDLI